MDYFTKTALFWPLQFITVLLCLLIAFWYYLKHLAFNNYYDYGDVGYGQYRSGGGAAGRRRLVEGLQRRRRVGDLPPPFPNGWFGLIESCRLTADRTQHVRALGRDFMVVRKSKGGVRVEDSDDQREWHNREVNDWIFVWHHAEDLPPSWEVDPVPQVVQGDYWLGGRVELLGNYHIQDAFDNIADFPHFMTVHQYGVLRGSEGWQRKDGFGILHTEVSNMRLEINNDRGREHLSSAYVTYKNKLNEGMAPFHQGNIKIEMIGPGMMYITTGPILRIVTITPVDPMRIRTVYRAYCRPHAILLTRLTFHADVLNTKRDFMIWNHKTHWAKPLFLKEEVDIVRLRRWFSQFYKKSTESSTTEP